mgnify:CR=1 FL=1
MKLDHFTQMQKRAHLQQLCSFLLDGVDLDNWQEGEDNRSYEQRIQDEEHPIWELLEQTFLDRESLDEAVNKLNDALVVNQRVYMEIGVKAGAVVMFELLQENPNGKYRNPNKKK